MSGTVGGGAVHLHCGGRDLFDRKYTGDCFTFVVSDDGTVLLDAAPPLPSGRAYSCHGSDGERLVVAGGYVKEDFESEAGTYLDEVAVYNN